MPINIDYFFIFFIPIDADALTPSRNTRSYTKLRFVVPVKDDIVIYHNKKELNSIGDFIPNPPPLSSLKNYLLSEIFFLANLENFIFLD